VTRQRCIGDLSEAPVSGQGDAEREATGRAGEDPIEIEIEIDVPCAA